MKKYTILILLSFIAFQEVTANHTKGGWMYYQYLGPGINDPSKLRYTVGLNLYIDCNSTLIEPTWNFSFFDGGTNVFLQDIAVSAGSPFTISGCTSAACYPCLQNIPQRCYKIINYETIVELAPNANGYTVSKQRCCRVSGIANVQAPSQAVGASYSIKIPGSANGPTAQFNSSPKFIFNDTAVVCGDNPFSLNFKAVDPDLQDSLAYFFCSGLDGGSQTNANPATASNPPHSLIPYAFPYSGGQPLGSAVQIDPTTGKISGIAPPAGEYVLTVCVLEYRGGIAIGQSRKELHLRAAPCTPVIATPNPSFTTCDGFNINFFHNSSGANTVFWDFGDPTTLADTSWADAPSYIYPDTGVYKVTFIINRGQQCTDTAYRFIGVYPGFFPGFSVSQPNCTGVPVQFNDTSRTNYGFINSWSWDFGNLTTLADTSHLQNPSYTYNNTGTYDVNFIVTNSKGCVDTVVKQVTVNPPPQIAMLFRDSTYCGLDSIQLVAGGTGNFGWTPNSFIIGANTATPIVFPPMATKYYVALNANGCISKDSVTVNPLNNLTATITATASSICEADTVTLTATANHSPIVWQWNNVATLSAPTDSTTKAFPSVTTNYVLTARWGNHCIVTPNKTIVVKPLAIPNAGPDQDICAGQTSAQLNASGGNTYTWTPTAGLNNPNIPNPLATPIDTTMYIVSVGVTGCTALRNDTVLVFVNPQPSLAVTNDTLICNIDTLQLIATGAGNFVWSPNYMINNVNAQNPLVSPDVPTTYYVTLTDGKGCKRRDSVFVDVKPFVTLNAGPDTSVCKTDGFLIRTTGDALHYIWTPSTYLDDPTKKQPFTTPLASITYHVIANIGKCQSQDDIAIKVVLYPAARAGLDTTVCFGDNAQLSATGGTNYSWFPATFLNNRFIANPVAIQPTANVQYIVTVTDTLGCPKPGKDTMWVRVYLKVIADAGPRDTSVIEGQPLLLKGSGGLTYLWSPAQWLSSINTAATVATPLDNIEYALLVRSAAGCLGMDSIRVKVYKVEASIYVPSAFTPNGDGLNDVLRPIVLGMKQLTYFKVFNRWGQMVFSSSDPGQGWDGTLGGRGQDAATYVWEAEGVTYKNVTIRKKGYAVLIR